MQKHEDYYYFILDSTNPPQNSWFNIVQEDSINTLFYNIDQTQYILKAKKEYVSPQMADILGASTYVQLLNHINNFEPEKWHEPDIL